ncbi:CDP-alcohol phosphatidyltransferase family protein [Chengkuizengella sediminis]|uniref:CDP-alcohol phosphatidyltransferase family protein n=1 Tax=Chengkuizengella sediminis TaxID=1885917 RepID=UPI00138A61EA|nr:CDP-alcohol phosphatidyltransferase family protein [Chengkuizengella sediminis]NDI34783.1 CDP-diacylglycerol--glycerol-3-phosphate 3-phosphatidyltransferase [Chengkuizengella sediminis]
MNLPNLITLFRFTLIPVYLILFFSDKMMIAFIVVVAAILSDILDGYIARKREMITEVGIMLDPLADKLMMITVFISLLYEQLIPWQAAIAIFLRDIGMVIGGFFYHFQGKKTVPANVMGKLTTILYYSAIFFIILNLKFSVSFLWIVIIFSFITSIIYIFQFKSLNQNIPKKVN